MIDSWRLINIDPIIQTFSVLPRQKHPPVQHQHGLAALTFPERSTWSVTKSEEKRSHGDVSTNVHTNADQMFGRDLQIAASSDDLIRIISADKLRKDAFSRWCIHRLLSEYSFITNTVHNNGVSGMFPQNHFPHRVSVPYLASSPQLFPRPRSASRLRTTLPVLTRCCGFTKVFLQLCWKAYFIQLSHRVKKQAEYSLCCLANKREICTGSCWRLKTRIRQRQSRRQGCWSMGRVLVYTPWRKSCKIFKTNVDSNANSKLYYSNPEMLIFQLKEKQNMF